MKKILKSRIFTFILGAIIFGFIGAVSAYSMFANDIEYTPKDTTWKKANGESINNVKDALDELRSNTTNELLNKYTVAMRVQSQSNTRTAVANYIFLNTSAMNYKYFKITSINTQGDYTSLCYAKGWSGVQSKSIDLELNTEYEINSQTDGYKFSEFNLYTRSTEDNKQSKCYATLELYNK